MNPTENPFKTLIMKNLLFIAFFKPIFLNHNYKNYHNIKYK